MKMKFGAIVTDGRGKIGGHVASKNRSCAYLRTKVTPVNRQSVAQSLVRNRFTTLAQAWRGLTAAQILAWNAAVAGYATTNIFGDLRNPSGINLFQSLNNVLLSIGKTVLTTPPAPAEVAQIDIVSFTATSGTPTMVVTLGEQVPADTQVKVYATASMSAGKSFVKSEYRYIGCFASPHAAALDIATLYTVKFGAIGAVGTKIFVQVEPVNETTGQTGTVLASSVILAA
jgi:hypothetical protein